MKGIGVDPIEGLVFVIGRFKEKENEIGSVTIATIPMNPQPGIDGIITTGIEILTDRIQGTDYKNTTGIFKYLAKTKSFLINGFERTSSMISIYDDKSKVKLTPLWYPSNNWKLGAHFDEVNKLSYICSGGKTIKIYPRLVSTQDELYGSGSFDSVVLNNNATCFGISNSFNGLSPFNYTVIYASLSKDTVNKSTTFYIGSADCVLCKRDFFELYTYFDWITGFHIFNNIIYFSAKQGIFQMNVPGTDTKLVISNDPVDSFEFVDSENTIYYISNQMIKKVNVKSLKSTILYDSKANKNLGTCKCAPGFTGDKCNLCIKGTVQSLENNSIPHCVNTTPRGTPDSFQINSHCNSPYFICLSNECTCRTNFLGNKCDQCQGKITFASRDVPICTPSF